MSRLKNCLVCYSQNTKEITPLHGDNDCFGNSGKLAEEVLILFVVRRLLQVPSSICERFLKDLGSPSEWCLTFCGNCQDTLKDAKEVAKVIFNLEGKLNGLAHQVRSQIQESYKESGEPPRRNFHKHLEAVDEIRYCVAKGLDNHNDNNVEHDGIFPDDHDYSPSFDNDIDIDEKWEEVVETPQAKKRKSVKIGESIRKSNRLSLKPKVVEKSKQKLVVKPELFKTIVPNITPLNSKKEIENVTGSSSLQDTEKEKKTEITNDLIFYDTSSKSLTDPIPLANQLSDNGSSYSTPDFENVDEHISREGSLDGYNDDCDMENSLGDRNNGPSDVLTGCAEKSETEEEKYLKAVAAARFRAGPGPQGAARKTHFSDSEKPFKCSQCRWRGATEITLEGHINRVHKGMTNHFVCQLCEKGFSRRALLERHLRRTHVRKRSQCSQCPAQFSSEILLDIHVQKRHIGNKKPISCQLCQSKFSRLNHLEKHVQEFHEMTVTNIDGKVGKIKTQSLKKKTKSVLKKFKCSECEVRFISEDLRHSHVQRIHKGVPFPYPCDICQKPFAQKAVLKSHMRKHKIRVEKPHLCPVNNCGKMFKLPHQVRAHIECVHENRRDFICEVCSNSYKSKKALIWHQAEKHFDIVDVPNFPCQRCDRRLGSQAQLDQHVKRIHENIYPFRCSYCDKGLTCESDKIKHEVLHTGQKSFFCETCGKGFSSRQTLNVHNRIHTGEKPYHCNTCGEDFRERTWFKRHQELHTGILHHCPICGKGFPIKHNLGIHMKSHANKNGTNNERTKVRKKSSECSIKPHKGKRTRKHNSKYAKDSESESEEEFTEEYQCELRYN